MAQGPLHKKTAESMPVEFPGGKPKKVGAKDSRVRKGDRLSDIGKSPSL